MDVIARLRIPSSIYTMMSYSASVGAKKTDSRDILLA